MRVKRTNVNQVRLRIKVMPKRALVSSSSPTQASPATLSLYPVVHSHLEPPIVLVQKPFSQNPGTSVHSLTSIEKVNCLCHISTAIKMINNNNNNNKLTITLLHCNRNNNSRDPDLFMPIFSMLSHTNAHWKWNKTRLSRYAEKKTFSTACQVHQADLDLSTQSNILNVYKSCITLLKVCEESNLYSASWTFPARALASETQSNRTWFTSSLPLHRVLAGIGV